MLGLVNRAMERFVRGNYGDAVWEKVTGDGELPSTFEHLLDYHPETVERVIASAVRTLGKVREDFLEDLGHFLVTDPGCEAPRRLLRFGGAKFGDLLCSLDDLPERIALVFPGLELATIETEEEEDGQTIVRVESYFTDADCVVMGMLRALADDYGALATVERIENSSGKAALKVSVLKTAHAPGRDFRLSNQAAS